MPGLRPWFACVVFLAGCASPPASPARSTGERPEAIFASRGVELYGTWSAYELAMVEEALSLYANKNFSGLHVIREHTSRARGGEFDLGKIIVREATLDVLVHELGHASHSRCPDCDTLNASLEAFLPFDRFASVTSWADGRDDPRDGFVSPYAAMNVYECVAESIAAAKLWASHRRGPLGRIDWKDERFMRLYELIARYNLLTEDDWAELNLLRKRR